METRLKVQVALDEKLLSRKEITEALDISASALSQWLREGTGIGAENARRIEAMAEAVLQGREATRIFTYCARDLRAIADCFEDVTISERQRKFKFVNFIETAHTMIEELRAEGKL